MTKKKQKKKWRDSFEKYEKNLENQKGNLTESLTNHRLIILSARETARETTFSHTKKTTRQTSDYSILICLKYANVGLK